MLNLLVQQNKDYCVLVLILICKLLFTNASVCNLIILHNSNVHSMFAGIDEFDKPNYNLTNSKMYGGFARLRTYVKREREKAKGTSKKVLFINNGDIFTGSAYFYLFQENIVAEMMNLVEYDIMSLGNLEFYLGMEALNNFIKQAKFPVILTNIRDDRLKNARRSHVIKVNNHLIGFVAYLIAYTRRVTRIDNIEFTNEICEIRSEIGYLRALGVKTIIALGNTNLAKDKQILKRCEGIDLLISGSGELFWNGPKPSIEKIYGPYPLNYKSADGSQFIIASVPYETKYVGRLELIIDTNTGQIIWFDGNPVILDDSIKMDKEVISTLQKYDQEVHKSTITAVGFTHVDLEVSYDICKIRECTVGNLVTDAMVDFATNNYSGNYWTDASMALIPGGCFMGKDIRKGIISEANLYETFPFIGTICLISIRGKYLLKIFRHSLARYPTESLPSNFYGNEFLQLSGMFLTYDLKKIPGRRLTYAYVKCAQCDVPIYEPVEKHEYYNIVMPKTLYDGMDGYGWFKEYGTIITDYKVQTFDIIKDYMKRFIPIYPHIEGRITLLPNCAAKSTIVFTCISLLLCAIVSSGYKTM